MTLRRGDSGPAVRELQRALVARGQRIPVDGAFGPMTEAAVRAVQGELGQAPTGVADPAFLQGIGLELREPAPPRACVPDGAPAGRWLRAFPVVGDHTYHDDFGAPRHQGRHEGIDIMAARGTPVVSATDATVLRLSRAERGLGGIWVWTRDAAGTEFYYAHLDSIAGGLAAGSRVAAGQRIGAVGNTGDARFGAPHLHFEVHPDGGRAVNPYRDLRAVDPGSGTRRVDGDCAAEAGPRASSPSDVRLSVRQLRINQRISQTAVRRVNRLRARLAGTAPPTGRGPSGRITLSRRQLLINQRISQTALMRARAVRARLDGRPAAGRGGPRSGGRVTLSRRQLLINQRISQAAIRTEAELRPRVEAATG